MSVKMRQEVERKIATAFVTKAIQSDFALTVDNGDGESKQLLSIKDTLTEMFQGGDDCVYVYKISEKGIPACIGWVWFVYGNDGWDVISDYTTNLESLMGPANKIADYYED
jgi:hypothetical protein